MITKSTNKHKVGQKKVKILMIQIMNRYSQLFSTKKINFEYKTNIFFDKQLFNRNIRKKLSDTTQCIVRRQPMVTTHTKRHQ